MIESTSRNSRNRDGNPPRAPVLLGSSALLLPLLFLLLGGGPLAAEEPAKMIVVLKPSATGEGPFLTLKDIAHFPNDPHGVKAIAASVFLGLSPQEGEVRRVHQDEILKRLKETGLPPESIRLEGYASVVVVKKTLPEVEEKRSANAAPSPLPGGRLNGSEARSVASSGSGGTSRPVTPALEAGTFVMIRSDRGVVQIEEPGRTLESGRRGDVILVSNLRTGKKISARVAGPKLVVPVPTNDSEETAGTAISHSKRRVVKNQRRRWSTGRRR